MTAEDEPREGTLTVLFTDVVGSTALRSQLGDDAAHELLTARESLIRGHVKDHGGREVKSLGDGLLVTFTSARKAVTCAVAIQRTLNDQSRVQPGAVAPVRIGINTGEVTGQNGDIFGAAVNAAARIAAKATGGQILVASVVKELAGVVPDTPFVSRGRYRLKGFPDRWQLFEVGWRGAAVAGPVAAGLIERTPLVGRTDELARTRPILQRAFAGHGGAVLVKGEPGVGKTRLADEAAAEAEKLGFRVLTGHCEEAEGAAPYLPFVEILEKATQQVRVEDLRRALGDAAPEVARVLPHLRRMFPDMAAPLELPPEQERRYLFNSIRDFLGRGAAIRPQCLVIDDLHWADQSTLLLLEHVAEQLGEYAVVVIATYRDAEVSTRPHLAQALEHLLRRHLATEIALHRLPEAGTSAMLAALASGRTPPPQLVAAIYAETEGNPFFIEEVFKHLTEEGRLLDSAGRWLSEIDVGELDVPSGVRLVIGRRLDRLGAVARGVLAAAAVVGRSFSYALLRAAADVDEDALLDALDEAERARLIGAVDETGGTEFSFAHELIRQTLLAELTTPGRQRLHLRIARALEQVLGDRAPEHAAEIAHHFTQSGDAADRKSTLKYLCLAGEAALNGAAFEEAAQQLRQALVLARREDGPLRIDLAYNAGLAERAVGRGDEALTKWREALALCESEGVSGAMPRLCTAISLQLSWAARFQEAVEVAAQGLGAGGEEPSADRARLLGMSGVAFSAAGNFEVGESLGTQALAMAAQLGDIRLRGELLSTRVYQLWCFPRLDEGAAVGIESASAMRASGDLWYLANVLPVTAFHLGFSGRIAEAALVLDEAEPLAARLGHHEARMMCHRMRGLLDDVWSDHDRAQSWAQSDLDHCLRHELPWYRDSYSFLSTAALHRGDTNEAVELARKGNTYDFPWVQELANTGQLIRMLLFARRREEALALWSEIRETVAEARFPLSFGAAGAAGSVAEGMAFAGEREEAASLYPALADVLRSGLRYSGYGEELVETSAGIAAAAGRDWQAASAHFEAALQLADEMGLASARPLALRSYALMRQDRHQADDREIAQRMLTEALDLYKGMGWPWHVELTQSLLT